MKVKEIEKILSKVPSLGRLDAKTLAYLLFHKDEYVTSRQIEYDMNLRQPEASASLSRLKKKKWLDINIERTKKTQVKGRPIQLYKLSVSCEEILGIFIEDIKEDINNKWRMVQELKTIINGK